MRPQLLLAAVFGLVTSSCFSPGDGQAPPLDTLYFPTGLALDDAPLTMDGVPVTPLVPPAHLYVASSDFDLQYRSSALAAYDLNTLSAVVPRSCNGNVGTECLPGETCDTASASPTYFCVRDPKNPCGALGEHSPADMLLYPGRCNFIDPNAPQTDPGDQKNLGTILSGHVGIGAFATDAILRKNPQYEPTAAPGTSYPERLFLPVRGDATLHWIDLDFDRAHSASDSASDSIFKCGQNETDDGSCDDFHRAGNSVFSDSDQLRLPAEPFGVDATKDGAYVAVTNQTTGSVSLFANDWSPAKGASLQNILTGLPSAPVAIAAVPQPLPPDDGAAPGFLVAYSNAAQIDLLRVHVDGDDPKRYVLSAAGTTAIGANSLGFDSRGIVIDTSRQDSYDKCVAKSGCSADQTACLAACVQTAPQPSVYAANRAPPSLLVGRMTADAAYAAGSSELPAFFDSIPLVTGASRVVLGNVKVAPSADNPAVGNDSLLDDGRSGPDFALEPRVFVVCFDSRRIYVYDPVRRVIDAIIPTGRGPFALAIDGIRGLGYVAHFTDSYLGVISLDQRFPQTYASIVASIGQPMPPRASK